MIFYALNVMCDILQASFKTFCTVVAMPVLPLQTWTHTDNCKLTYIQNKKLMDSHLKICHIFLHS